MSAFPFPFDRFGEIGTAISGVCDTVKDALAPAKPLKSKRHYIWEQTRSDLANYCPKYDVNIINAEVAEISTWKIYEIKQYITENRLIYECCGLRRDDYDYYRSLFINLTEQDKVRYEVCKTFLWNYYPEANTVANLINQSEEDNYWCERRFYRYAG